MQFLITLDQTHGELIHCMPPLKEKQLLDPKEGACLLEGVNGLVTLILIVFESMGTVTWPQEKIRKETRERNKDRQKRKWDRGCTTSITVIYCNT